MGDTFYLTQLDNLITNKQTYLTNIISAANSAAKGNDTTSSTLINDKADLKNWQEGKLTLTASQFSYAGWKSAGNTRDFLAQYEELEQSKPAENHEATYNTYGAIRQNQNDLDDIIKREQKRLDAKQQTVDGALFQQTRLQTLNNSYRLRYKHYLYMLMIVIVVLVLVIVLNRLGQSLTIIPETVMDMLYILVITIGGFMLYFAFIDMRRRDHMDFEKVQLSSPPEARTAAEDGVARRKMISEGDLLGLSLDCVGKDCCPDGAEPQTLADGRTLHNVWDEELNKCTINIKNTDVIPNAGFTTMKRSVLYEPPIPSFGFAPAQDIKTMDNAHYL